MREIRPPGKIYAIGLPLSYVAGYERTHVLIISAIETHCRTEIK